MSCIGGNSPGCGTSSALTFETHHWTTTPIQHRPTSAATQSGNALAPLRRAGASPGCGDGPGSVSLVEAMGVTGRGRNSLPDQSELIGEHRLLQAKTWLLWEDAQGRPSIQPGTLFLLICRYTKFPRPEVVQRKRPGDPLTRVLCLLRGPLLKEPWSQKFGEFSRLTPLTSGIIQGQLGRNVNSCERSL